jgi:hypothetical protein
MVLKHGILWEFHPAMLGLPLTHLVDILRGVFYTIDTIVFGKPGRLGLMYLIRMIRENP